MPWFRAGPLEKPVRTFTPPRTVHANLSVYQAHETRQNITESRAPLVL
jgi:hypothetical protein